MSDADPVDKIVTPTRLDYSYTAAGAHAEFLDNISRGKLVGKRCPGCKKVYVPARGNCPRCGIATAESVEVADKGTVTTFCIVRVPSENIDLELPYCAANILLDGSDMHIMALLHGCTPEEVHIGMRVKAVWKPEEEWEPTFENIRWFTPNGEPDAPVGDNY